MLLYSMLFLTGYDLTLDDLKSFRQWGSKTPGHPEYGLTAGVETTTGPLGQGISNSVGMAIVGKHLLNYVKPQPRSSHLVRVLDLLGAVKPTGPSSLPNVLGELTGRLKRRGMDGPAD